MQKENYEHSVNISKTGQNLSSLNAKVKSDRRKGVARMNANERRSEISKIMEVKRVSTAFELASVFGVSEKTIFRDIDIISLDIPLHKVPGRGGGIRMDEWYHPHKNILSRQHTAVLTALMNNCDDEQQKQSIQQLLIEFGAPSYRQK